VASKADVDYHVKEPTPRPSSSDLWFFSYLPWALAVGLTTPLIPLVALFLYKGTFATAYSPLVVAVVVAASDLTEIPFTVFWGNLSDRLHHRKYFMVGSFVATGLVLMAMPFMPNLQTFILMNVLEGVCMAASAPIGTVLLLETRQKRWWPRDIGVFGLVSGVGTVGGLALGAIWLYVLGWNVSATIPAMQSLLILTGVLALLSGIIALRYIEEPEEYTDRESMTDDVPAYAGLVSTIRGLGRRALNVLDLARGEPVPLPRSELFFLASLFIVNLGSQMCLGTLVYFLTAPDGAGLSQAAVFVVFLASALTSTALMAPSGKAADRYSPKNIFLASIIVRAILIPVLILIALKGSFLYLSPSSVSMIGATIGINGLIGVTLAFASTASTVFLLRLLSANANKARGKAVGLYYALSGFGGLLGTLVGGWVYAVKDVTWAYGLAAIVLIGGCLIIFPIHYHFTPYRHVPLPIKAKSATAGKASGVAPWTKT
jgi:MFS family permease